jgi:hypothetical protein
MSKEISRLSCFAQPQVVPRLGSRWWSRHRFIAECAGRGIALVRFGGTFTRHPGCGACWPVQPLALSGVAGTSDQGARSSGTSGQSATCGLGSSAAATHGSADGDRPVGPRGTANRVICLPEWAKTGRCPPRAKWASAAVGSSVGNVNVAGYEGFAHKLYNLSV